MATIIKRGNLQYQATIRKTGFKTICKTFETRLEAEAWATAIELQMERGTYVEKNSLSGPLRFTDLLDKYATVVTPTKKGKRQELSRIRNLQNYPWVLKKVEELHVSDISDYKLLRMLKVSHSTVNRELALISAVMNHAIDEWGVQIQNLTSHVKRPMENPARDRVLSDEELMYLIKGVDSSRSEEFKLYFLSALYTGFRKSEVLRLDWEDIDAKGGTIFLPDTKNGCSRTAPIGAKARGLFESSDQTRKGKLFEYVGSDPFKKAWNAAKSRAIRFYVEDCLEAGEMPLPQFLKDFRFHDLRHHAFTNIARVLKGYVELSVATGHKSPAMIKRYVHLTSREVAAAMP